MYVCSVRDVSPTGLAAGACCLLWPVCATDSLDLFVPAPIRCSPPCEAEEMQRCIVVDIDHSDKCPSRGTARSSCVELEGGEYVAVEAMETAFAQSPYVVRVDGVRPKRGGSTLVGYGTSLTQQTVHCGTSTLWIPGFS